MNELERRTFIDNLRATKPPYECPVAGCGRVYKSFSGIQAHLMNAKQHETSAAAGGDENCAADANASATTSGGRSANNEQQNVMDKNQKIFEYESLRDSKTYKINVLEPLEVKFINNDANAKPLITLRELIESIPAEPSSPTSPKQSPKKVPEANFRILDEFSPVKSSPMPQSFIKYIEKPIEELEDEVEYDMDEEDYVWLSIINESRQGDRLPPVSESILEKIMDFFEKSCHFASTGHHQSPAGNQPQLFDEDAVCCVCLDGECDNLNAILFCDMCNLSVHQECYGVPYIPEGQWLCRRCQLSPSQAVDCVLCPNRGGAFKQTSDSRWAHVVCAIWVPEIQFANTVFLEPIEGFERIPPARWRLSCFICKQKRNAGACIQCHKPSCYTAFHVTCAQLAGLYMKIEPIKDGGAGGCSNASSYAVRKTAFCDAHEPEDEGNEDDLIVIHSDARRKLTAEERREESRNRIRKARRLLNRRRNSSPNVSVPVVSKAKIEDLDVDLKFNGKQEFLNRILAYWTLKRQSRFGVPLLRRLQVNQQRRSSTEEKTVQDSIDFAPQIFYWKKIRRDLEKARLLIELLRKREQRKREITQSSMDLFELCLQPMKSFMINVVEKLTEFDELSVFAKPVSDEEVPGYSKFISNPMDLGTMTQKADKNEYFDVADIQKDFNLMISNCLKFNQKNQFFIKYAQEMRKDCAAVWNNCRENYEDICKKVAALFASLKQERDLITNEPENPTTTELEENFNLYFEKYNTLKKTKKKIQFQNLQRSSDKSKNEKKIKLTKNRVKVTEHRKKLRPKIDSPSPTMPKLSNCQSDIRNFFNNNINDQNADESREKSVEPIEILEQEKTSLRNKSPDRKSNFASTNKEDVVKFSNIHTPGTFSAIACARPALHSYDAKSTKSPDKSPIRKSPNKSKISQSDSFKMFRQVSPRSPTDGSDLDKTTNSGRKSRSAIVRPLNSSITTDSPYNRRKFGVNRGDSEEDSTSKTTRSRQNSPSKISPSRRQTSPVFDPPVRQIIDVLLEHLDIVWAFTPDYPHYFPGVVIDPKSDDYPSNIPRLPKDMAKKLNSSTDSSNSSQSTRYLIYLFDKKQTWRWLEKRLVEPMFVDNDLDRRKLISPNKKSDQRLLKRAYKNAVDFRCHNTGEDASEFSILDEHFSVSEDSEVDSS